MQQRSDLPEGQTDIVENTGKDNNNSIERPNFFRGASRGRRGLA